MSVSRSYERVDLNDDPNRKIRNERHEVSPLVLILIIVFACFTCFIVDKLDQRLPRGVSDKEAGPFKFSSYRAQKDLVKLSDFGPKVSGSEACTQAEQFLLTRLNEIKANAKLEILVDRQQTSGQYWLKFSTPFLNAYSNAVNVVAMLVGSNGPEAQSLLINCHYDSVPESPGASDDIINCAAMLEVLSVLSKHDEPLRHNIVFLFNGAEENPLQASHGFITQHKWAQNVTAFINLEAAGMGGRECLFQAGPGRSYLIEAYSKSVPYPHAQVAAEELFHSGVIPSDTDFRIFRDFADIPGLDIAFARYGQVYHTKYDMVSLLPIGSLQRVGDNVLALSKSLANSVHLDIKEPQDDSHNMVYFDYLGFFMVWHSAKSAMIVNWIIVVFAFVTVWPQLKRIGNTTSGFQEIILCVLSSFISTIITVGAVYFILPSLVTNGSKFTGGLLMKWYSRHWLVIPLYCLPIMSIYATTTIIFDSWRSTYASISPIERAKIHLALRQMAWALIIVIILLCGKGTRAVHILTLPLFVVSLSSLLLDTHSGLPAHLWFYAKLPFLFINFFWSFSYSLLVIGLILPILGRLGSAIYPEMVVGVLCLFCTTFSTMGMCGMEVLLARTKKSLVILLGTLAAIFITMFFIIMMPINPYRVEERPSPQRYLIMHTIRKFYEGNSSAGYWIVEQDSNSPDTILKSTGLELEDEVVYSQVDCESLLGCGYPLYTGRTFDICQFTTWIEASPPKLPTKTTLALIFKECNESNTCITKFRIAGPTHMNLMLCGTRNVSISAMGIDANQTPSWIWRNRAVLMIYRSSGIPNDEWIVEVTAQLPPGQNPDEPFLEVALSGHSTFHNEYRTDEFIKFISNFPEWIHLTSFLSSYETYMF